MALLRGARDDSKVKNRCFFEVQDALDCLLVSSRRAVGGSEMKQRAETPSQTVV